MYRHPEILGEENAEEEGTMPQLYFRSIWISDLHLGTRNLQNRQLLDFLRRTESDYLYLVGDIFDFVQARKKWHWSEINDQIVEIVLDKAQNGTKVVYIPGNHDHMVRKFCGNTINNVEIALSVVHETAAGHRYLVMHGDTFDPVIQKSPWLADIGGSAYNILLSFNRLYNKARRALGLEYTSISAWLKHQVKLAVNYMGSFEKVVVQEAERQNVDGLICGHIHKAGIREIDDVLYNNTGDWVESCTALAENHEGRLGIIEWQNENPLGDTVLTEKYEDMYRNRCLASSN